MTITTPPPKVRPRLRRREEPETPPRGAVKRGAAARGTGTDRVTAGTTAGRKTTARPASAPKPSVRKPAAGTTTRRAARPTGPLAPPARTDRPAPPARTPFVLVIVGLLGGALVSLLLLNTVLAQDAFTLSELQRGNRQLSERKEALQEEIAREESPEVLHNKALGLDMVDSRRIGFFNVRTGRMTESGSPPPGMSADMVAAAAAGGVTGAPGAIVPPLGGTTLPGGAGGEGGTR